MAAFNFPNSPSTNDLHTENGVTYKWNGTVWKRQNASYTDATNLNVTGIATFANNVSIGGTLTYEDVKNVDSVGVITARDGVQITADNKYLKIGAGNDISIVHTGGESVIANSTGHLTRRSDVHKWENYNASTEYLRITSSGKVGINTTSPVDLLSIGVAANTLAFGAKDTTRGNHIWQLLNNDNSGNAEFRMYKNSVTGTHAQSINFATSGDANYILDGNFGIGIANPVANLEVRDTKANLIVAKDGLTVKGNSDLHTTYDFFQIGAGGAIASYSTETVTASTHFIHNAYRGTDAAWKRRYADTSMRLSMNSPGGAFRFESAASGSANADITWSEKLRIDSSGNIGQGVTPKTWNLGKIINVGYLENALHGESGNGFHMVQNAYYNSGWKKVSADLSSIYTQWQGTHIFYTNATGSADDAITWQPRLKIDSSGRLLLGTALTTSAHGNFDDLILKANGGGNAGITIVTSTTTQGTIAFSDGTSGTDQYRGYVQYSHNGDKLALGAGGDDRLTITSTGNLGLGGITTPLWTTGGGMHLNDAYGIGFGNGGSGRPDFQIVTTAGSTLDFRCGFGGDTADIQMTTGGEIKILGTDHAIRWYRDDGARHGSIYYDGGNFNIKSPSNDHTRVLNSGGTELISFNHDTTIDIPGGVLNLGTADTSSGHLNALENLTFNIDTDDDDSNTRHFKWFKNGNSGSGTELMKLDETGLLHTVQDYPTQRPVLDFNFSSVKKLDPRITYSRFGPGSYTDEFGIVKLVGDNVPRFDHDPTTRESKGFLIEAERTNLIYPSSDWSVGNPGWTINNSNITVTTNTSDTKDPAGTYGASKLVATQGDTQMKDIWWTPSNLSFASGTSYAVSCFAKSTTGLHLQLRPRGQGSNKAWATYNLSTGVVGNSGGSTLVSTKIEKYPNGWYRCSLVFTGSGCSGSCSLGTLIMDDGNDTETVSHTGDASKSIYLWGAQHEVGGFRTSYIPTDATFVARGADRAYIDGQDFTDVYNVTEGTFVLIQDVYETARSNQWGWGVEKSTNRSGFFNGLGFRVGGGGAGYVGAWYMNNGSQQAFFNMNAGALINIPFVSALAYKVNDMAATTSGITVLTDTSATIADAGEFDRFSLGSYYYDAMSTGHIQRVMYYPKRLSNTQLVTLTS